MTNPTEIEDNKYTDVQKEKTQTAQPDPVKYLKEQNACDGFFRKIP